MTEATKRYLCLHCNQRFAVEGGAELRCPGCLRTQGLQALSEGGSPPRRWRSAPRWVIAVVLLAIVGSAAATLWWWRSNNAFDAEVPRRPLTSRELQHYLGGSGTTPATLQRWVAWWSPGEALEAAARKATTGPGSAAQKSQSWVALLRRLAEQRAWQSADLYLPPQTAVRSAAKLWSLLRSGQHPILSSLEISALTVVALRSVKVAAMLVRIDEWPGDEAPADPSGSVGYFAVAVPTSAKAGAGWAIIDVAGEHQSAPHAERYRVLSDVEVVAAALSHQALFEAESLGASEQAYRNSQQAIDWDHRSAWVRAAHGLLLARSGSVETGVRELQAAAQLHPGAAQHNNLAQAYLAVGDRPGAEQAVASALRRQPRFFQARLTLAQLKLSQGQTDEARRELETIEAAGASPPSLPMLWALYYLSTQDAERAAAYAQRAVDASPNNWQMHLQAAQVFQATGRTSQARQQADTALAQAPASQRGKLRELVGEMLKDATAPVSDTALPSLDDLQLKPGGGSGATGSSGLRLRDPSQGLQLRPPTP